MNPAQNDVSTSHDTEMESEFGELVHQIANFGAQLTDLHNCYTNSLFGQKVKLAIIEQMVDELDAHMGVYQELYSKISDLLPDPVVQKPSSRNDRKAPSASPSPAPTSSAAAPRTVEPKRTRNVNS